MNLVVVTALIAVCGAAKLDRTYLPPASAKTAGGSPGSLQTPFARNSLNNGLGGLPKGSYENDFQGVVVDAAAAGTRASEPGESGLGAPRISYGSTNSKVGGAAFKTRPSAFVPAQSEEQTEQGFEAQGSLPSGAVSSGFQQGFEAQGSLPSRVASSGFQQGFEAQGSFPSGAASSGFQQGSSFSNAEAPNSAFQQQSAANSDRPRASLDRSASILRYENEVGPESYHYAFETDNGISAEENGVATNGVQAQGGFSYTGDDGQVYSVSYTADERGYQPKGDHLPTPPPIPEEILKSLEQNARDEAAGLSDDGSYDAQRYNAGSDYAESEDANGKFTHQSSKFGADTDAATFNQNQGSRRPVTGQSSFNSQAGQGSNLNGQNANRYSQGNFASGTNGASNGQGFNAQSGQMSTGPSEQLELTDDESTSGQFGQAGTGVPSQTNGFGSFSGISSQSGSKQSQSQSGLGNRNEYLPPTNRPNGRPQGSRQPNGRPQNDRPQAGRPQALEGADASQANQQQTNEETPVPLGQQDLQDESRPQQAVTSFGKPISNGITSQNGFGSSNNQLRPSSVLRPSSNNNNFVQGQSSQTGRPNEYLPPTTVTSPNRRPLSRPQSANTFASQFTQQNQESHEDSEDVQSQDQTQDFPGSSSIGSQSTFGSQPSRLQKPQPSRQGQKNNRFTSQSQTTPNSVSAQSSFGFNSQKATAPPATELTTPFESSNNDALLQSNSQTTVDDFTLPSSQQSNGLSAQASFVNQQSNGQNSFGSQSISRPLASRPQKPRPFGQSQASAYPTQSSIGQFNQNGQFINQPQSQSSFGESEDAQYSSSTQRPNFTGQPQGADDSYYYNQPSKPFGTPQGSRFPSAPSNQFNRVTQQSSFEQSMFSNGADNVPSTAFPSSQFQGSTKYPRPPVIRPTAPTSQIQGQFGNNYRKPGSTKQPRPPTLASPTSPTGPSQSQYQNGNVNGVTQAAISPFPSQTPTQAPQGQFGSRPTFQQSQYNQGSQSSSSSFSQESTMPSFTQQSTASASFSRRPSAANSFPSSAPMFGQQTETQGNNENEQPVPSQQYTGEIYEYTKPAVTLPPPDSTPASPQFGNKMPGQGQFSKPQAQFGQTSEAEDHMTVAQFGSQSQAQGSRPQFAQSKPQFGQTFGAQAQQNEPDMKPFGALAQSQTMFGSQASKPSRPQFSQSKPQFGQTQNTFGQSESTQELEDEKPQFGSQPETESEAGPDESQSPEGPKNQFGFVSACCKDNASRKPAKNQYGVQSQVAQSSFAGIQKQPTNSFAGKGEEFGGPRQPPSFDDETGYHY